MSCLLATLLTLSACGEVASPATQQTAQPAATPATATAASAATKDNTEQGPAQPIFDPGPSPLLRLDSGIYEPLFPGRDAPPKVLVAAFELERTAVSNAQFLAFVAAVPRWRRGTAPPLFVDEAYLSHWRGPLDVATELLDRPVTNVSWFAARAYATWRQRRLPTIAEWELAAALPLADGSNPNATVLAWYGSPTTRDPGPATGGTESDNGLLGLHGIVWEWVADFSTAMLSGDGRSATDLERSLFCGAGAVGATRPDDYAAFMRLAMRSSLRGESTSRSLGFRCARSLPTTGDPR